MPRGGRAAYPHLACGERGAGPARVRRFTVGEPVRHLSNMTRSLEKLPVLEVEPA